MTSTDTDYGTLKRNSRCRNKICACTGACFVNDGTGDFAPQVAKKPLGKKFSAAERKALGLDKMPEDKFGQQRGVNPRFWEEPYDN